MASDGVYCGVVSSAITGVPNVHLVEAEALDVDPLRMAFTPDMLDDHGFHRLPCCLVVGGLVFLDVKP